jgi:hypothetical protein
MSGAFQRLVPTQELSRAPHDLVGPGFEGDALRQTRREESNPAGGDSDKVLQGVSGFTAAEVSRTSFGLHLAGTVPVQVEPALVSPYIDEICSPVRPAEAVERTFWKWHRDSDFDVLAGQAMHYFIATDITAP